MKSEHDLAYFKECKRDAILMIAGGVIAIIAAFMLKSHLVAIGIDAQGMKSGWKVGLVCMTGIAGVSFLTIGLALGISLFGQTTAEKLVEIYGLPSTGKRRLYSLLCGVNVLALIAAIATTATWYGIIWLTAFVIIVALIGIAWLVGIANLLREIDEDEREMEIERLLDPNS